MSPVSQVFHTVVTVSLGLKNMNIWIKSINMSSLQHIILHSFCYVLVLWSQLQSAFYLWRHHWKGSTVVWGGGSLWGYCSQFLQYYRKILCWSLLYVAICNDMYLPYQIEAPDPFPPNKRRTDLGTPVVLSSSSSVTFTWPKINIIIYHLLFRS